MKNNKTSNSIASSSTDFRNQSSVCWRAILTAGRRSRNVHLLTHIC